VARFVDRDRGRFADLMLIGAGERHFVFRRQKGGTRGSRQQEQRDECRREKTGRPD
jgi:hypothetical protein